MLGFVRRFWFIFAAAAYAALLVVVRGRPSVDADAGIFLSVAGRLLSGDQLYVDVLDNKDPLFFYSHAVALASGDWRVPFLLDVVWVAVAAASTVLLLRAVGASRLVVVVGFVAYPLLLTGAWYFAGYSTLAAMALAPLIAWLWTRSSFALAGALLCAGMLFKINLALVLGAAPLVFLALRLPPGRVGAQVARAAAGFAATFAAAVAVLAVRGELRGYAETLVDNVSYSSNVLGATGRVTGIPGHIKIATGAVGDPTHIAIVAAVVLLAGLLAIRALRAGTGGPAEVGPPQAVRTLAALFLGLSIATGVTLALTASWYEHMQLIAFAGLFLIVLVAAVIEGGSPERRRVFAACAAAGVCILVLGGAAESPRRATSISTWLDSGESETADLLERAADEHLPGVGEVTFAHLGQNDERAVAAFLDERFVLACPEIAQYVFTPDLTDVSGCIRDERPQLVLVTPLFEPVSTAPAAWDEFVAQGAQILDEEYERVLDYQTDDGTIEVWALREPAPRDGPSI